MEPTNAATLPAPDTRTTTATERPWLWNIVLHDSDDHTYEYVIEMLAKLFAFDIERAFALARAVDTRGRGVILTTHREHAELKAEQVRSFGPDPRIASCATPLRVTLEPAESD